MDRAVRAIMKWARSFYVFASGCAVYGVMAACSSAGDSGHDATNRPDGSSVLDPVDEAKAEPGSRLRPNYLRGDDGSRQFFGWFDTQLNVDCTFLPIGSDWRCVPAATTVRIEDQEATRKLEFVDAPSCDGKSVRLAYPAAGCSTPALGQKYLATVGKDSCGTLTYRTYEEIPNSQTLSYIDLRSTTQPCGSMGSDRQVHLSDGTRIDLSKVIFLRSETAVSIDTFVKATKGP